MREWIDLFSAEQELCEAKRVESRPYASAPEGTFFVNPTASDLEQMVSRHDFRGITDGYSVFVWDAHQWIHGQGAWAISAALMWEGDTLDRLHREERVSPKYRPDLDCFYLYDPTSDRIDADAVEWIGGDKRTAGMLHIHYWRISPHVAIAIPDSAYDRLMAVAPFARLMRNATPIVDDDA